MHMIGISGRCASGARAPPAASTPSPSTPAHVEGARFAFERKTGCHVCAEPCVLGGPVVYAMGVFNPCLVANLAPAVQHARAADEAVRFRSRGRGRTTNRRQPSFVPGERTGGPHVYGLAIPSRPARVLGCARPIERIACRPVPSATWKDYRWAVDTRRYPFDL